VAQPADPRFPRCLAPSATSAADAESRRIANVGFDVSGGVARTDDAARPLRLRPTAYIAQWQQQLDGVNFVSVLGRSVVGPVPRWRHYLTLNWNSGSWGASLAQTISSGYTDANRDSAGRERQVGAYDVWDLQGTYAGFEHTTIALGIKNLLDRDPPFSNQSALGQVMYDPRYADPRGRVFYAQLTVGFK
jgi:iron complex outermembrane receptor protein